MHLDAQMAKEFRFSANELKARAVARHRADIQLMRAPWSSFRKAYEEYPRWHALTLWTNLMVASQGGIQSWLVADLRKRCMGFRWPEALTSEPLDLLLSEWVRNQKFGYAKRQGWLDALTFYGVRHPRSESAWNYWEQCTRDWNNHKTKEFPSFEVWWCDAQKLKLSDKLGYREVSGIIRKCLSLKAVELWVRPLFASHPPIPPRVLSELKQVCPGIIDSRNSDTCEGHKKDLEMWRDLKRSFRSQLLSKVTEASVLEEVLERAQYHPLYVRLAFYGRHWLTECRKNRMRAFPSFREWLSAADRFILGEQI